LTSIFDDIDQLFRHIVFIVLGEDGVGREAATLVEPALRNNALSFAKEVGKNALICNVYGMRPVGHVKSRLNAGAGPDTADFYKAAKPHSRRGVQPGRDGLAW